MTIYNSAIWPLGLVSDAQRFCQVLVITCQSLFTVCDCDVSKRHNVMFNDLYLYIFAKDKVKEAQKMTALNIKSIYTVHMNCA